MPGNDLSATRDLIPVSSDTRAVARANITTVLTNILNDIEPKVTPAGLDITADLSFLSGGSYQAATNVGYLNMEDRSADPSTNESVFVKDDELYFLDGNGNSVKLTAAGIVNTAGSGDIVGAGYGTNDVELRWDSATDEYRFKKAAGASALADLVCDKIRFDDGGATFATLGAPVSMAGDLDFLLPGTFPAASGVVTLDSVGALDHTRDISVDTVTITGEFVHGVRQMYIHASGGLSSAGGELVSASTGEVTLAGSGTSFVIPIPLAAGDRITSIVAYLNGGDTASKTANLEYKVSCDGSAATSIATGASTASGTATITLSSINHEINTTASSNAIFFRFTAAHANDRLLGIKVSYDHPA